MEVRIRIYFANGAKAWDNNVIQDLDGCGSGWSSINFPVWYRTSRDVTKLRVTLWATEDGQPYVRIARSRMIYDPQG